MLITQPHNREARNAEGSHERHIDRAPFWPDAGRPFCGGARPQRTGILDLSRRPVAAREAVAWGPEPDLFPAPLWNLLALFARFRKADGDGLLAALHCAAATTFSAPQFSAFEFMHFTFHVLRRAA